MPLFVTIMPLIIPEPIMSSTAGVKKQVLQYLRNLFDEEAVFEPDEDDLDALPYPAFDLLSKIDQVPIVTSIGCPYRCSYCSSHILQKEIYQA